MRSYPLYINGEDCAGVGWTYVPDADSLIRDPRRTFSAKRALELGRPVERDEMDLIAGRCARGCPDDNLHALEAASRASQELLRALPLERRRETAHAVIDALQQCRSELIEIFVAEGHPRELAEWEASGVVGGVDHPTIDWMFDQMSQHFRAGDRALFLTRKPDGVVCLSPPQNAAGGNAALGIGALLAGNALVVKAPRTAPLSVMYLFREIVVPVFERWGAPPGTINLVSGSSKPILRQWLESPLVDDILFFGDSITGLKLGEECVSRGKKAILELAGNDAFVVWRDADLDAAADALTEAFHGSGQICMVPKQAIVHPEVAVGFATRFVDLVRHIRPGYPSKPGVVLSPVLKTDRFYDVLHEAVRHGCQVLVGGERVDVDGQPAIDGMFVEPTIVRVDGLAAARELRCVHDETFYPLLPLVVMEADEDDTLLERLINFLNSNPYGLRNSLWTRDQHVIDTFVRQVTTGGLLKVNDSHIGFVPFLGSHGGTGLSGGPYGELHYPIFRTSHLQGVSFGARSRNLERGQAAASAATAVGVPLG